MNYRRLWRIMVSGSKSVIYTPFLHNKVCPCGIVGKSAALDLEVQGSRPRNYFIAKLLNS